MLVQTTDVCSGKCQATNLPFKCTQHEYIRAVTLHKLIKLHNFNYIYTFYTRQ